MLSEVELAQFAADGYLILHAVVDEPFLVAAEREIDDVIDDDPPGPDTVGPHFYFLPPTRLPSADAALRSSGALEAAGELVSPLGLDHGLDHIQIALNIPPYIHRPGGPHIDGHRPDQAEPHSFTMLAAIFLTDESQPDSGNLWVWPGSHMDHQAIFKEQGTHALLGVSGHTLSLDRPPRLSEPRPVLAARGDLLLAHFLLGHNIGGNQTDRTRTILYYRLSCPDHRLRWESTFLDPLTEYEPVRNAFARSRQTHS
ncbi:MAG TPA: phytanoyl-CoA dioxygenase family protein [Acidimicrobiales bacterium]|nr:phytanoyl-CoA dioxygenase family protein [Acidimicrobiales bacterium]